MHAVHRHLPIALAVACSCAAPRPVEAPSRGSFGPPVLLLPVEAHAVVLLDEERRPIREALLPWFQRRGYSVVSFEEVDRLRALSDDGRRMEGGPLCAAPVGAAELRRERFPAADEARARAECSQQPCRLVLSINGPRGRSSFEATVSWPQQVSDWVAAVERLAPPPPYTGPGATLSTGTSAPRPPVEVTRLRAWGAWAPQPSLESLEAVEPRLAGCHEPDRSWSTDDQIAMTVDARGAVARCEATSGVDPDSPQRLRCLCAAWAAHAFAPGAPDRRLVVWTRNALEPTVNRDGYQYGVFIDVPKGGLWPHLGADGNRLARCHADRNPPGTRQTLDVEWAVDPAGRVTGVELRDGGGVLRDCALDSLRRARFVCPPGGRPQTAHARIVLSSYRPGVRD